MITFLELGSLGRLGNQLFQYAALRGLGLKNNYEVKIPDPTTKEWHGQKCLLNNFNIEAAHLTKKDIASIQYSYIEKDPNETDRNFFTIPDNTNLQGFFQSLFYFGEFEEEIKKELTPQQVFTLAARDEINKIKSANTGYEIVSVHLRRGDLTSVTKEAGKNLFGSNENELDKGAYWPRYFSKASQIFKNKRVKFLVFSGGCRGNEDNAEDMEWCRNNLKDDYFLFSEGKSPMEDFCSIMHCDHNILSPGSSFGWWAAYLNPTPHKKVVAPHEYHPDELHFSHRSEFYPSQWTVLPRI